MTQPPPPPGGYPPPPENVPPRAVSRRPRRVAIRRPGTTLRRRGLPAPAAGQLPAAPSAAGRLPAAPSAAGRLPAAAPARGYPPPPPQGGYPPPPPPGGYAGPGGYPPPVGYGGAPGFGAPAYSVGEAVSWAWNKFSKNAAAILVPTLVFGLVYAVVQGIIQLISGQFTTTTVDDYSASFSMGTGGILVSLLGSAVMLVVAAVVQSAYVGGMLDIANGQPVEIGSFFKPRNVANVVIASVVSGLIVFVGVLLCIVPGIIATIMLLFTTVIVLDRNTSGIDGVTSSFEIGKKNFGPMALTWLTTIGIAILGVLACGVGLLVAYPLISLITVYAYRRLTGGQVAPLTP